MTKKIKAVVYGEGGFDASKPDDNVVEIVYYTNAELKEVTEQETIAANKQAILDRIGLTADELQTILG
jgi:hypothetical protein